MPAWGLLDFQPQRGQRAAKICIEVKTAVWSLGSIGRSGNALLEVGEWKGKSMAHCLGHLWQLLFSWGKKKTKLETA